ncbi:DUF4142 domain-containing protein [Streptosporangium sp. NBC_01756]|uniref:DUF4142 domain-containing protein n=1 Tax=Streptosporangium sp. NBC_01756 TaxID=2975950 RepID=UPI002DDAA9B6|nr:DUF4142 domain-containing protein [Streptosporangium sp. NBC_01756]WSC88469.1 DUF4142 domain-containing protein [Streptosporangium sp. NBC_01756]
MTPPTPPAAITAASVAALALMSGSPVSATAPTPAPKPTSTSSDGHRVAEQDMKYLIQAHQSNLAEIAAGRSAQSKGKSKEVRSAGALLAADHTKLDSGLQQVAQRLKATLPTQPTARQQAKSKELAALSGAEFDRAWTKWMIYSHRTALVATRKEIDKGSVPQVKAFAKAAEPIFQADLNRLLAVQKTVGALRRDRPETILRISLPSATR